MGPSKDKDSLIIDLDIVKRVGASIIITVIVTGMIFFISVILGSQVSLSTFQVASLTIGVCAFIFTIYPYVEAFYTELTDSREPEELSQPSRYFSVLSSPRRYMALRQLRDSNGKMNIRQLTEEIAAQENNVSISEVSPEQRKRVYIGLYQNHLPKLENASLIQYNKEKGIVKLTKQGKELIKKHDLYAEHFDPRLKNNTIDNVLYVIRNTQRRYVLHYLTNSKLNKSNINDLTEQVTAWDKDCTIDEITSDDRKEMYIALHETHLEILDDSELINWHKDTGLVELTSDGEVIGEWISNIEGKEDFPLSDLHYEATI